MGDQTAIPGLTILLPLKGRHLHTLRFLWHANRQRLPYHFLIADGEVHPQIAALLQRADREFSNIAIEYIRYPDDIDLTRYQRKMADAVGRVRTPYVMQADNDDFLIGSGLERCLTFLESEKRFVSCAGGIGGFAIGGDTDVTDAAVGVISHYYVRYNDAYLPRDFDSPLLSERIMDGFATSFSIYYNVYRTDALKTIFTEIAEINFSDLHLCELYFGMRAKTLGMARSDPTVMSYLRQFGSSMNGLGTSHQWVDRLVHGAFSHNVDEMVCRIAKIVAERDDISPDAFANTLRTQIAEVVHTQLSARFRRDYDFRSRLHPASALKAFAAALGLESLVSAGRAIRGKAAGRLNANAALVERQKLLDALGNWKAPTSYIDVFSQELNEIASVIAGDEFLEFIRAKIPELLPRECREAAR